MGVKTSRPYPNLSGLSREQRLSLYGLAVGASLAAGAASAQANLITLDLTGLPVSSRSEFPSGGISFDVNAASAAAAVNPSPGAADFALSNFSVVGVGANGVQLNGSNKAARLTTSNFVGPAGNFGHAGSVQPFNSDWGTKNAGPVTGFVGLKFQIGSDFHFGWAQITNNNSANTITLDALGYESVAGIPAHVEPAGAAVPDQGSTLALLAIGATGLLAFRRQQKAA